MPGLVHSLPPDTSCAAVACSNSRFDVARALLWQQLPSPPAPVFAPPPSPAAPPPAPLSDAALHFGVFFRVGAAASVLFLYLALHARLNGTET